MTNEEGPRWDGWRRARTTIIGRLTIRGNGRQRDMAGCARRPDTDPTKGAAGRRSRGRAIPRAACPAARGTDKLGQPSKGHERNGRRDNYLDACRNFARFFTLENERGRSRPTALYQRSIDEIERLNLPGGARLFANQRVTRVATGFRLHVVARDEMMFQKRLGEFDDAGRNRIVVNTYANEFAGRGPAIVFCVNRRHADRLAVSINRMGSRAQSFHGGEVPRDAQIVKLRSGHMSPPERALVLDRFRDGSLQVLTCVQLLTEGFDLPAISTVFLARPTLSTLLLTQMIGRGLRGPAVGGSAICHVIDFSEQLEIHKHRDSAQRLRVASPKDADRFRRGLVPEEIGIFHSDSRDATGNRS